MLRVFCSGLGDDGTFEAGEGMNSLRDLVRDFGESLVVCGEACSCRGDCLKCPGELDGERRLMFDGEDRFSISAGRCRISIESIRLLKLSGVSFSARK